MMLFHILDRPPLLFAALAAASGLLLGGSFAFQFIGGLDPCALCIWQRYPYGMVICLGLLGAGLARSTAPPMGVLAVVMGLAALALFTDAAIAAFHVGVEQKWWQGTQACVGAINADNIEALHNQLLAQKVLRCNEVTWSLGGISMAGYNMAAALALGIAAGMGGLRIVLGHANQGETHE